MKLTYVRVVQVNFAAVVLVVVVVRRFAFLFGFRFLEEKEQIDSGQQQF